jgi:hypothetical protein
MDIAIGKFPGTLTSLATDDACASVALDKCARRAVVVGISRVDISYTVADGRSIRSGRDVEVL